jgi:hypothetical protein
MTEAERWQICCENIHVNLSQYYQETLSDGWSARAVLGEIRRWLTAREAATK